MGNTKRSEMDLRSDLDPSHLEGLLHVLVDCECSFEFPFIILVFPNLEISSIFSSCPSRIYSPFPSALSVASLISLRLGLVDALITESYGFLVSH